MTGHKEAAAQGQDKNTPTKGGSTHPPVFDIQAHDRTAKKQGAWK